MASQPVDKKKSTKPNAVVGFFHDRKIVFGLIIVLVAAGAFFSFRTWLDLRNERESAEAAKELESGNYKAAYSQLKQVETRGGTPQKNSEEGYLYYLKLARAAYLSGDSEAAKHYAKEGIKRLPPEGSEAEANVGMDGVDLYDLAEGIYRDPYEYQGDMPPVEGR